MHAIDFELASYYTSTHPQSVFVRTLTLQQCLASARHMLRGRQYTVRRDGEEIVRELSAAEVESLVRDVFELEISREDLSRALGVSEG